MYLGTVRGRVQWLGRFWLFAASAFIAAGLVDLGMQKGWLAVGEFLSPANFLNWLVIGLTLAPGLLAFSPPASPLRTRPRSPVTESPPGEPRFRA